MSLIELLFLWIASRIFKGTRKDTFVKQNLELHYLALEDKFNAFLECSFKKSTLGNLFGLCHPLKFHEKKELLRLDLAWQF